MELGSPFSQLLGEFQGRSETFSDSAVAHPAIPIAASAKISSNHELALPREVGALAFSVLPSAFCIFRTPGEPG